MKLRNKTALFQNARKGEEKFIARPFRTIDVPEGCEFNKEVFEILGENKDKSNKKIKGD